MVCHVLSHSGGGIIWCLPIIPQCETRRQNSLHVCTRQDTTLYRNEMRRQHRIDRLVSNHVACGVISSRLEPCGMWCHLISSQWYGVLLLLPPLLSHVVRKRCGVVVWCVMSSGMYSGVSYRLVWWCDSAVHIVGRAHHITPMP